MKTWLIVVTVIAVLLAASTGVGFWMWGDTQDELASTEAELANTEADLAVAEVELANAENELTEIKEVYPQRHFDTYTELENWVDENTPIEHSVYNVFEKCVDLQEEALAEGYILSVYTQPDMSGIINMAIAGDSVYYIWLDGYIEWATWR